MNKQMKKIYKKAMRYYNNGSPKKALSCCDKAIGEDITCAPLLSLKGLILYQLGDLKGAQSIWTINTNINGDSASRIYLSSIASDEKRLRNYQEAEQCIKSLNISEAIALLQRCEESDFNTIKVSKALSSCYVQKGQYLRAEEYIHRVLDLDKEDAEALKSKKALNRIMGRQGVKGSSAILVASIFILVIGLSIAFFYRNSSAKPLDKLMGVIITFSEGIRVKHEDKAFEEEESLPINEEINDDDDAEGERELVAEGPSMAFPSEEAALALIEKDYEALITIYKEYKDMEATIAEKAMLKDIHSLLKNEGTEFYYASGLELLKQKSYIEAEEAFNSALEFSSESYLNSHIIYMLASSYKESGNLSKALEGLENYAKLYPKHDYTSEALYNLATLYQNIDDEKSYSYAALIQESYPKSIYYNTIIKQILE